MDHCKHSNKCILRYNHYSNLALTPIGLRNHHLYTQLLTFQTLSLLLLIPTLLHSTSLPSFLTTPIPIQLCQLLLLALSLLALPVLLSHLLPHLREACHNTTKSDQSRISFLLSQYAHVFNRLPAEPRLNVYEADSFMENLKQMYGGVKFVSGGRDV